jgi:hypothetical protein
VTLRGVLSIAALLLASAAAAADDWRAPQDIALVEAGRRLYEEGRGADGTPLRGVRGNGLAVAGREAACVACHRPSGMGTVEGDIQIRPITGRYLFGQPSERHYAVMDPRVGRRLNEDRPVYTGESLARALREGVGSDERVLNAMMPRYTLSVDDMHALRAYLSQLSRGWSAGVEADTIHFATVIAPGADPARREIFLRTMNEIVRQKNMNTVGSKRPQGRRNMVSPPELMQQTERQWTLDVWELQGAPSTWAQQLNERFAARPVFALVSGLGGAQWGPVQAFCEAQRVPCWLPSVDAPPQDGGRYGLYFHRGLVLEAEVLAAYWQREGQLPKRLVQWLPAPEAGGGAAAAETAATRLAELAVDQGVRTVLRRTAPTGDARAWKKLVAELRADDAVMAWLPAASLASLAEAPAPTVPVHFSGGLLGLDPAPLPAAWHASAHIVYPFELPQVRQSNQTYFFRWLDTWHLPVVDLRLQSEVYFAMTYLSDTVAEMLHNLYGDYLVERAEQMLRRREAGRAEQEARERRQLRPISAVALRRQQASQVERGLLTPQTAMPPMDSWPQSTTIYPRLGLGPSQRHASKGAYVVRFGAGDALEPIGDWIVP